MSTFKRVIVALAVIAMAGAAIGWAFYTVRGVSPSIGAALGSAMASLIAAVIIVADRLKGWTRRRRARKSMKRAP